MIWTEDEERMLFAPIGETHFPRDSGSAAASGKTGSDKFPSTALTDAFMAWTTGLVQPLVSLEARKRAERLVLASLQDEPHNVILLLSAFTSSVAAALNDRDPWTRLSVTWDLTPMGSTHATLSRRGTLPPGKVDPLLARIGMKSLRVFTKPGSATGAYRADGSMFGKVSDLQDVLFSRDLLLDVLGTETGPTSLTAIQSAILGLAPDPDLLRAAMDDLWDTLAARLAHEKAHVTALTFWAVVEAPIRWLLWRHQSLSSLEEHTMFVTRLASLWLAYMGDIKPGVSALPDDEEAGLQCWRVSDEAMEMLIS